MNNIIGIYINKMNKNDILLFAKNNNINLNANELDFIYSYIKKNWKEVLSNPNLNDIDKYKNYFSNDNFIKIKSLLNEYYQKYKNYL